MLIHNTYYSFITRISPGQNQLPTFFPSSPSASLARCAELKDIFDWSRRSKSRRNNATGVVSDVYVEVPG